MKHGLSFDYKGALLLFLTAGMVFGAVDIPPTQSRAKSLDSGENSLLPPVHKYDPSTLTLKNPFAPKSEKPKVVLKNQRPDSDQEFLVILAAKLNPTGVLMLGDDAVLLFGEKKMKVGDTIRIPFDNDNIEVELIDISRTSFTLKLNHEQLTRPIKPAKSP